MEILAFQIFIVLSIIITRIFAKGYLAGVCLAWTAFTFLMVFATPLFLLQLCSIWGTYALLAGKEKDSGEHERVREAVSTEAVAPSSVTRATPVPNTVQTAGPILGTINEFLGGVNEFLDEANDHLRRAEKVRRATADLEHAIHDERVRIDSALKGAETAIICFKGMHGFKPESLRVYMESSAKQFWDKKRTALPHLDPAAVPSFDLPLRDPDDRTADAVEARLRELEADRSKRLTALAGCLRADEVLRFEFAEQLEWLNAARIWHDIRRVAGEFDAGKVKRSILTSARSSNASPFDVVSDTAKQEMHTRLQTHPIGAAAPPSPVERSPADLEPGRPDPADVLLTQPTTLRHRPNAPSSLTTNVRTGIAAEAMNRGIPNVVHFTRVENLPSIMKHGLCPITVLRENNIRYRFNDLGRYDGHRDASCLSIAHPNERMFYKYRMGEPAQEWAVLILDMDVLSTSNAAFCRHNATDMRMRRLSLAERMTDNAFAAMFAPADELPAREADRLQPYDPTDVQAEVLVFDRLQPSRIKGVAFTNERTLRQYSECLGDNHLFVQADRTGLFGLRSHARKRGLEL